jgi:hypothetical protein
MKAIDHSIALLNQIETKRPPTELYDKVRRRVLYFERRLLIQLLIIITLGLFMTILVINMVDSNQTDQLLESYFSTHYNFYGYE